MTRPSRSWPRLLVHIAATAGAFILTVPVAAQPRARNVVVITIDGLRWQEFFGGADGRKPVPAPSAGIRREVRVTTSQVASTIAALVGEDFSAAVAAAAPPLPLQRLDPVIR